MASSNDEQLYIPDDPESFPFGGTFSGVFFRRFMAIEGRRGYS
jgi:hypothetical protein